VGWVKRRGDKDGGVDKGRSDKAFVSPGSSIPGAGCTACLMEKKRVRGKQRIFMAISKGILHVDATMTAVDVLHPRPSTSLRSPDTPPNVHLPYTYQLHLPTPTVSPSLPYYQTQVVISVLLSAKLLLFSLRDVQSPIEKETNPSQPSSSAEKYPKTHRKTKKLGIDYMANPTKNPSLSLEPLKEFT